jgi:hypothetical protein
MWRVGRKNSKEISRRANYDYEMTAQDAMVPATDPSKTAKQQI